MNFIYFDDRFRKECRTNLVNFCYNKLKNTKCSRKIWAFIIKAWHFTFPYMAMFIFIFGKLNIALFLFGLLIMAFLLYIYLKGCFISHLEYKLYSKNYINIIDPYLICLDYPITNENRYWTTLYIALSYFLIVILILYVRLKIYNYKISTSVKEN